MDQLIIVVIDHQREKQTNLDNSDNVVEARNGWCSANIDDRSEAEDWLIGPVATSENDKQRPQRSVRMY